MRVAAVLSLCVCLLVPAAADAETGRVRRVGPWNVAATTEKGVFQYCMMARPETKASPGFGIARGASQLTLAMFSQKWKLEKGTSYPVTLVAGSAREELQARVESSTAVTVDLTGRDAFVEGLARVPSLEVRAAASTLRLPLDQGAAALARLRDCLAAEAPAPTNPFASAAERPGGGQAANPFKAAGAAGGNGAGRKAACACPRARGGAAHGGRGLRQGPGRLRAGCGSGSPDRRLYDGHRERPRDAGGPGHRRVEPRLRLLQEGRPRALDRELYRGDPALSGIPQSALGARRRPHGSAGLGRGHRRLHRGAEARSEGRLQPAESRPGASRQGCLGRGARRLRRGAQTQAERIWAAELPRHRLSAQRRSRSRTERRRRRRPDQARLRLGARDARRDPRRQGRPRGRARRLRGG